VGQIDSIPEVDSVEYEVYENFWQYGKEVGINVTPLASKFIPFNLNTNNLGNQILALKTKWYGKTRAFIINFGFNLNSEEEISRLYLGLGYERRRNVSHRLKYTTGWELALWTGDNPDNEVPFVGLGKSYGIEYHFYHNFYISTETRLLIGVGDEFNLELVPPTSIYFNMLLE
jgi:hypothetical protein